MSFKLDILKVHSFSDVEPKRLVITRAIVSVDDYYIEVFHILQGFIFSYLMSGRWKTTGFYILYNVQVYFFRGLDDRFAEYFHGLLKEVILLVHNFVLPTVKLFSPKSEYKLSHRNAWYVTSKVIHIFGGGI